MISVLDQLPTIEKPKVPTYIYKWIKLYRPFETPDEWGKKAIGYIKHSCFTYIHGHYYTPMVKHDKYLSEYSRLVSIGYGFERFEIVFENNEPILSISLYLGHKTRYILEIRLENKKIDIERLHATLFNAIETCP